MVVGHSLDLLSGIPVNLGRKHIVCLFGRDFDLPADRTDIDQPPRYGRMVVVVDDDRLSHRGLLLNSEFLFLSIGLGSC